MQPNAFTPLRILWKHSAFDRRSRITRPELLGQQQRRLAELRRFGVERSPSIAGSTAVLGTRPSRIWVWTKATMMDNFDDLVTDRRIRLADAHPRNGGSDGALRNFVVLTTSDSTGLRSVFLFSTRMGSP